MKKVHIYGIAILTMCNMFNYLDRNIFNAISPSIERDLHLSQFQIGLCASAFFLIYVPMCPLMGFLGDKYNRPKLLSFAVFFWSLATTLSGFARGFWSMIFARGSIGVGEAVYSSIGPSLVEDTTPKELKSRVMAFFLLSLPLGTALGYILGGYLEAAIGWRYTFFVIGAPGMLLCLLSFFIKEPIVRHGETKGSFVLEFKDNIWDLLKNKPYLYAVIGYTAFTFVTGGMTVWMPKIMLAKNLTLKDGNMIFGATMIISGILGTVIGGFLSDKMMKKNNRAPIFICFISLMLSIPFAAAVLYIDNHVAFFTVLFICEVFLFINTAPITIVLLDTVREDQRNFAMGLSILAIQAFGGAVAPPLIGWFADKSDIISASTLLPLALVVGCIFWFFCFKSQKKAVQQI